MRTRVPAVVLVTVLVLCACTSEAPEPRADDSDALVSALPDECEGLGAVHEDGEITFSKDGRLYGVTPDGSQVRCLLDDFVANSFSWGAEGDRLLVRNEAAIDIVLAEATSSEVEV